MSPEDLPGGRHRYCVGLTLVPRPSARSGSMVHRLRSATHGPHPHRTGLRDAAALHDADGHSHEDDTGALAVRIEKDGPSRSLRASVRHAELSASAVTPQCGQSRSARPRRTAMDATCARNYHHRMNEPNATEPTSSPLPSLYLGHGAPPLLEDEGWMAELRSWAEQLPRPKRILIVSAHWQSAPLAISSTRRVPLVYDFYGFPEHYYRMTYEAPGAPDLAADVRALLPVDEPVLELEDRGLDHGAWVPAQGDVPRRRHPRAADVPAGP